MAGKNYYQRYINEIWKSAKTGNTTSVNRVFGALENDDDIEDILCTCREDLQLVYTILNTKPTIFAHIDNADLVAKLDK